MKYALRIAVILLVGFGIYRLMVVPLLEPVAASDISPGDDVVVFTTQWCGACESARNYLVRNDVPFRELDIEASTAARSQYEKLGGRGVQVAIIGERRVDGFSAQAYAGALRELLEPCD
jgi:glutaredoxin